MRKNFRINDKIAKHLQDWQKEKPAVPEEEKEEENTASVHPVNEKTVTRTDVGRVRSSNQDTVINQDGIFGVADGMGGHNGGEIASAGARRELLKALQGKAPDLHVLEQAITTANLLLYEQSSNDSSLDGMGTTLTVLWPAGENMLIGHVGDSRAYLFRDGKLEQQTTDHSMVAEMVRDGLLTEEQAATHPMRNYITRAVGTEVTIEAQMLNVKRQAGDRWLVCSDGLHGLVTAERIQDIMALEDVNEAADLLLQEALENGGRDNISLAIYSDEGVTL